MKSSQGNTKSKMEERVNSAVNEMKVMGISPQVTRSVLKNLLKACNNEWEHIEAENYRLLADAIFESPVLEGDSSKKKKDENADARDNGKDSFDRGLRSRKRPGTEMVPVSSGAEVDHGGNDNLDGALRNRKRLGKETIAASDGVVNVWDESSRDVQLASSADGEVNLSLHCNPDVLDGRGFCMPRVEVVCKLVEDRWLASAKKIEPNLSLMNILKEMCKCALELGSNSSRGNRQELCMNRVSEQKIIPREENSIRVNRSENNGIGRSKKKLKPMISESPSANANSLVVVQQSQVALDTVKRVVNPRDVSNGQERYRIPLVCYDDALSDFPNFHYVRHNIIYQKASVPISLARIGDEYCCTDCYGDCLKASISCPCAGETGGEYAYTSDGLLRDGFLDSYINKYRHTQEHHLHYCQICPLERIKNELRPGKCKGHLIGTFIKECWTRCGCNRQCGNRVVQRGIRCRLEVFYTGPKKGWGLRSPDELPKGTFVCEYAGEILTNMELHERTVRATGNEKHTYPVMLDADWASEGILEDEEALCLDATHYGNVARFMNHRCFDPNLVEIPVEIETPDHHYYHVAFFTTRKVEPNEELCWDYGIDFSDHKHPIKAFKCSCESKECRDRTRRIGAPMGRKII